MSQEGDAFDQTVMLIEEATEKIMGSKTEREEGKRINGEVFEQNITLRLKDAVLWFEFHLSFDKKIEFNQLHNLSTEEKLQKLQFWKYLLFSGLEGLEKE